MIGNLTVVIEGILDAVWTVALIAMVAWLVAMTFIAEAYQRRVHARRQQPPKPGHLYDWEKDGL